MAKQKVERFISPKGVARWAHLVEPDEFKGQKKFKTELLLPADECQEFMDFITAKSQEAFDEVTAELKPAVRKKAVLHLPFEAECDDETGEETGMIRFKFSSNAEYHDPKGRLIKRSVPLVDAAGNVMKQTAGLRIGNGSEIKVCYTCFPFHMATNNSAGVSLRIVKVQVVTLETWGDSDTDNEFGAEEGGYVHDNTAYDAPDDSDEFDGQDEPDTPVDGDF